MDQARNSFAVRTTQLALTTAIGLSLLPASAGAQGTQRAAANAPEEIIVTARKREELIMKTPVVMQAFSAQQVADMKIVNYRDLASMTPGLLINETNASSTIYFRGIGNGEGALFSDMAVLLNIDGLSVTNPAFYRGSMFDTAQIEVMKGPQALFFGRSASAGIISVTSADPTSTWKAQARVGYEFNADEMDIDGFISGPITDKLGIRLAGYHNTQKGYFINPKPNPTTGRTPNDETNGARLTLKYDDPDIGLRVKFKASINKVHADSWNTDIVAVNCNGTTPRNPLNAGRPCGPSPRVGGSPRGLPYVPGPAYTLGDPAFFTGSPSPLAKDGGAYTNNDSWLTALTIDYDVAPGLTLTSVTGYTKLRVAESGMFNQPPLLSVISAARQQSYSQELRLTSDWKDSWINFIVGGLYNPDQNANHTDIIIPAFTYNVDNDFTVSSKIYSGFGQVILTPIEHFELAGGARYTSVTKNLKKIVYDGNTAGFYGPLAGNVLPAVPFNRRHYHETDWSPEVTLTWRPTDDLTAFVAYKQGYRGPGLNAAFSDAFYDLTDTNKHGFYAGEKPKGVEGGVKATLFDRQLSIQAAAYHYKYNSLQTSFVNTGANGGFTIFVANGASAKQEGFELSVNYAPESIEGLTLNAAINYNDSRYTNFPNAPCFTGQSAGTGVLQCRYPPTTDPRGVGQDLTGQTLAHAPKVTGQAGFAYRTDVTNDYQAAIIGNVSYSSRFQADPYYNPNGYQRAFALLDATVRFGKLDGPWEIAFIGRNLTNKYYFTSALDENLTPGPGNPSDVTIYMARPRQLMLQLTVRPEL